MEPFRRFAVSEAKAAKARSIAHVDKSGESSRRRQTSAVQSDPAIILSDELREQLDRLHAEDSSLGFDKVASSSNEASADELYRWAYSTKEYTEVVDWSNQNSRVLLVSGAPGSGKTMLLAEVVRQLSGQEESFVAYYFCGHISDGIYSSATVLKSLIRAILTKQPNLMPHLEEARRLTGRDHFDSANDFLALSRVLSDMLRDEDFVQMYLIVDAIDECSVNDDNTDLDDFLRLIKATATLSHKIKWIVSTDVDSHINSELAREEQVLHLSLDSNSARIRSEATGGSVAHMVSALAKQKGYTPDLEIQVEKVMREKSLCNNLLWVNIACTILEHEENWYALKVLGEMPKGLDPLYDYARSSIAGLLRQDPEVCDTVLSTMAIVYRPLHIVELGALAKLPPLVDPAAVVKKCSPFLEVRDGAVFFVNRSARLHSRSYLARSTTISKTHSQMARHCLESLSEVLKRDISSMPELCLGGERSVQSGSLPMSYAIIHWMRHLAEVKEIAHDTETENMALLFMKQHSLHWLKSLSSAGLLTEAETQIRTLEMVLTTKLDDKSKLPALVRDVHRVLRLSLPASGISPLQNDINLLFAPNESILKQAWLAKELPRVVTRPRVDNNWSPDFQTIRAHDDWIRTVAFSPDGRYLVSGSDDGTVRLWDVEMGMMQQSFDDHSGWVYCLAFSSNGLLASGSSDDSIIIRDYTTGSLRKTLSDQFATVRAICFSPDSTKLASTGQRLQVWDISDFEAPVIQELQGHDDTITSVAFSQDGTRIVSGSEDETIRIWNADTNALIRTLKDDMPIRSVAFSQDGKHIASGSDGCVIRIWVAETGEILKTLEGHADSVYSVAFSADGKFLASASADKTARVWDGVTGELRGTLKGHRDGVRTVAFSPGGKFLASGSDDGTISFWDPDGIPERHDEDTTEDSVERGAVRFVAISPDGQHVATASSDGEIYLWNGTTGEPAEQHVLRGHNKAVNSVMFSTDGQRLISASADKDVRLWDVASGENIRHFQGHSEWVLFAVFSPDGQFVASASDDRTVRVWSCDGDEEVKVLRGHRGYVRTVAMSPDGKLLASGGGNTLQIWDRASWELKVGGLDHSAHVMCVVFSPDSARIISLSSDDTVRVWDTETGELVQGPIQTEGTSRVAFFDARLPEYMLTEFGAKPSSLGSPSFFTEQSLTRSQYGISADGCWITWEGKNVLSLPNKYQPAASWVQGQQMAIGLSSGEMLLFRFSEKPELESDGV